MILKNPNTQTDKDDPKALEQDIGVANPIAEALKRKRKLMAAARGTDAPPVDSYGNVTLEPEDNSG